MEAIYELYEELEIPVPEKFQRELSEEKREAWYERMRAAHKKFGNMFQVQEAVPLYPGDISETRVNYFSGTTVTVPLGEGMLNFCYADFAAAFAQCMPDYLRFIGNSASAPDLNRKKISGNREAVIRAFELHEQMFPTLSEVFYSSLYTAIFPPLFMKKTERAVDFYRTYQYCDRVAPGESRTCQQLAAQEAYQSKLKENDGQNTLNIYQKYYKRYFARVTSGRLKKEKFKQWQYEAVQKRDSCLNGELSLEEFIDWLEESMPNRERKSSPISDTAFGTA